MNYKHIEPKERYERPYLDTRMEVARYIVAGLILVGLGVIVWL